MSEKKARILYLEVLRVIAIFGVLFTHSGDYGAYRYLETDNAVNYWFGLFLASVMQYCVPLFFMITGALLLDREESISHVFKHRVLRMLIIIGIIGLSVFVKNYINYPQYGFDIRRWFQMVYEGEIGGQFWFLFEYTSFLLILPFLQRMVKTIPKESWFLYVFVAYNILNGVCPILTYYLEWKAFKFALPLFSGSVFYSIMGYFVANRSGDMFYKAKNVLIVSAVTLLLMAETVHLNHLCIAEDPHGAFSGAFAPTFAFCFFVVVRYICHKWKMPGWLQKVFIFAGAGAFGTYLLEWRLRHFFSPIYVVLNTKIRSYPATFVWLFACLLAGILLTHLLKKLPGLKKLL